MNVTPTLDLDDLDYHEAMCMLNHALNQKPLTHFKNAGMGKAAHESIRGQMKTTLKRLAQAAFHQGIDYGRKNPK